ncbi:MAG: YjfB family protein [Gallionella sp.]|nr:YjfB family protein [Gallionella sp.]
MNTSSALANGPTDTVGLAVLKKAINIEAQGAMALINALPQIPQAANLPPNLGQNINTTA